VGGPIFVVGSMGSGTTLLRLMLDSHPNIMIARETGFMRAANAQYFIPFWRFGDEWLSRIGLTEEDLDAAVGRFYNDVFGQAAAARGATRWGDKTPFHVYHMERAAQIFPDARFIGTVRHPGAVAKSVDRFQWSWRKGVKAWSQSNQEMVDHGTRIGDRFHLIRYEDLVTETEPVLREVFEFLGEPWDDQVLEHHRIQDGRAEGGTQASDPVDQDRMARWLSTATEVQIESLVRRTESLARLFGYDPREPFPVAQLNPSDPDLIGISGVALERKFAELQPIQRVEVEEMFENGLYTPDRLAQELYKAYDAGRQGHAIRPAYRDLAEKGKPQPSQTTVARARRKLSRKLNPDT
jgi:hypothetical protein